MNSNKIIKYKSQKKEIINLFKKSQLTEIEKKLEEFSIKNESYYSLYANYYYLIGEYKKGIKLLEEIHKDFPFSFEIIFNLASLKSANGEQIEALWLFARCIKIAGCDDEREEAKKKLNQIIELLKESSTMHTESLHSALDYTQLILRENDERTYPINRFNESLVKKVILDSSGNEYFTDLYKAMLINNVDSSSRYFFKTEMLKGNTNNSFSFEIKNDTTLPLGLFEQYDDIVIEGPKENYRFPKSVLTPNQFNYFTFSDIGEYKVTSKEKFFTAKPINLKPEKKTTQIIIPIFIDGLANSVIEDKLQDIMPHTFAFFSKGYINNNCYTTGDWTLPSVASMYTGKTTLNHGLYHPTNHFELNKHNHLFSTDFQQSDYMTTQINNDWRVTPTYGYLEGMDRILYQNYSGGFMVGEVVVEAIEHLETFKDNNHFMWISVMDLHDVADEINNDLMSQVKVSAKYRQNKNLGATSVLSEYDENKVHKYVSELKRIDLHLSTLYRYLECNYLKENIIVALVADHGQSYLKQDDFLLQECRRKVPFMLYGGNIDAKVSNELCSIIDIFPTIGKLANVNLNSQEGVVLKDFGGIGREIAITETIHPNQPYLVAITDNKFIFRFKTKSNVTENCTVDLEHFTVQLLDLKTNSDVTDSNIDKIEEYTNFVIQRAMVIQK